MKTRHCPRSRVEARVAKIQPQQKAYVERYNRTVRYDWLAHHLSETLDEIQDFATRWLWT